MHDPSLLPLAPILTIWFLKEVWWEEREGGQKEGRNTWRKKGKEGREDRGEEQKEEGEQSTISLEKRKAQNNYQLWIEYPFKLL